jgi:hypothetical protein
VALAARLAYQADPIDYVLDNPTIVTCDGEMTVFDEIVVNRSMDRAAEYVATLVSIACGLDSKNGSKKPARTDYAVLLAELERGYVGGSYFNPAGSVESVARRVHAPETIGTLNLSPVGDPTYVITTLYRRLMASLAEDELLFAVYSRGRVIMAPYLWDEERMLEFECQVQEGGLRRHGFYGVDLPAAKAGLLKDFV